MRMYYRVVPLFLAATPFLSVCHGESSSNSPGTSGWIDPRASRNARGRTSSAGKNPSSRQGWSSRNPAGSGTEPSRDGLNSRSTADVDIYGTSDSKYDDDFRDGLDSSILGDDIDPAFDKEFLSLDGLEEDYELEFESRGEGKGALYDAYNTLHTLAQDYCKPFDAPAVVVVGHQSSGKSALIEALMGFQFNQVGGGTKTRRPVALRMQYNPKCAHPRCFLVGEDGVERHMTLSEIQAYIEKENLRLERDPMRCFDSREINVRMEYKYCPNMILIDTPGLISAPKVPRGRNTGAAFKQQRALQASAREAERLVVEKMGCQDYIILCVEDTSDWKHGATREIVQKADPDLSRTVIVNTKLDTKVPQFGTPADVEDYIRAELIDQLSPHKMGGPFFTTVPSGRVGRKDENAKASSSNYMFECDEDFVDACGEAETADKATVGERFRRIGKPDSVSSSLLQRIGVSQLRGFLEKRVDECYRRNVAKIIPMLQAEYVATERRLEACERELDALSVERLKAGADAFADEFCVYLRKALQGSVVAPASVFGETLSQENTAAGSFHDVQGCPMTVSDRSWDRLIESDVGNEGHRLYGGAQYHRVIREFCLAVKCLRLPSISDDEIANAAGMGTTHDGVNFLHAACVIALEKARISFEPMLEALRFRVTHVMERLCPVTEYMLRETEERSKLSKSLRGDNNHVDAKGSSTEFSGATDISQNPQFRQLLRSIFDKFVQQCSDSAMAKTQDDLTSITRYVTWNLDDRSSGALQRSLPDQTDMVAVYQVALKSRQKASIKDEKSKGNDDKSNEGSLTRTPQTLTPIPDSNRNDQRDYYNLMQLMEEAVSSRDANRTNLVISGLVQHIVSGWRETFSRSVITKFNCYFMLPFTDEFHKFLRHELQKVYSGEGDGLYDVFDLAAARRSLQVQRQELVNECVANKRLQEKFEKCSGMMRRQQEKEASAFTERLGESNSVSDTRNQ